MELFRSSLFVNLFIALSTIQTFPLAFPSSSDLRRRIIMGTRLDSRTPAKTDRLRMLTETVEKNPRSTETVRHEWMCMYCLSEQCLSQKYFLIIESFSLASITEQSCTIRYANPLSWRTFILHSETELCFSIHKGGCPRILSSSLSLFTDSELSQPPHWHDDWWSSLGSQGRTLAWSWSLSSEDSRLFRKWIWAT